MQSEGHFLCIVRGTVAWSFVCEVLSKVSAKVPGNIVHNNVLLACCYILGQRL